MESGYSFYGLSDYLPGGSCQTSLQKRATGARARPGKVDEATSRSVFELPPRWLQPRLWISEPMQNVSGTAAATADVAASRRSTVAMHGAMLCAYS